MDAPAALAALAAAAAAASRVLKGRPFFLGSDCEGGVASGFLKGRRRFLIVLGWLPYIGLTSFFGGEEPMTIENVECGDVVVPGGPGVKVCRSKLER